MPSATYSLRRAELAFTAPIRISTCPWGAVFRIDEPTISAILVRDGREFVTVCEFDSRAAFDAEIESLLDGPEPPSAPVGASTKPSPPRISGAGALAFPPNTS